MTASQAQRACDNCTVCTTVPGPPQPTSRLVHITHASRPPQPTSRLVNITHASSPPQPTSRLVHVTYVPRPPQPTSRLVHVTHVPRPQHISISSNNNWYKLYNLGGASMASFKVSLCKKFQTLHLCWDLHRELLGWFIQLVNKSYAECSLYI